MNGPVPVGNAASTTDISSTDSTDTGAIDYTDPTIDEPKDIVSGPDGALWFTNEGNTSIGRITTAGVVTNYPEPIINAPYGIAPGADGPNIVLNELSLMAYC